MVIKSNYKFIERYIPPRCRKPRARDAEGCVELSIPTASMEDAPVAARHKSCQFPKTVTYRYWNGNLYRRVPFHAKVCNTNGWYTLSALTSRLKNPSVPSYIERDGKEAVEEYLRKEAGQYLILNGQVWEKAGEPRYVIHTFGLGHNHGGTSLSISNYYNSNIPGARYFNALNYDAALKEAIRIAEARGDTDYAASFRRRGAWKITVHIPEAFKFDPVRDTGPGCEFQNMLESLTEGASSAAEAGMLVMAAAMA